MKAVPHIEAAPREARHAAVVVAHPLLRVTESEETADPGAIADALELFVKWAVRAHTRRSDPAEEAADGAGFSAVGEGEQA